MHTKKVRKPLGPAFAGGELWENVSGFRVRIVSVDKYPGAPISDFICAIDDYAVIYEWAESDGIHRRQKDAWNFQVRYTHCADLV
jgi:hypothetical protein